MTETNRIEYKEALTDGLEKEVVAFLNYREGGEIHFGVNKLSEVVGINNPDDIQLKIKDRLKLKSATHSVTSVCMCPAGRV